MERLVGKGQNKIIILALLFLGWMVSYLDRVSINIAMVQIGEEFQLGPEAYGTVLSIFFAGYALMQIPGGWLADKFGSRKVLIWSVVLWSLFTILTGFAWSILSLIVIRFLFGLGEGGYPAASQKTVAEVFPKEQRARASSSIMSSNYFGGALAPILATPLIVAHGWRNMFFITGVLGIIVAVLFWLFIRPRSEVKELEEAKVEKVQISKNKVIPVRDLLKMQVVWKLIVIWFGIGIVNWGLASWMPTYLVTVRNIDLMSSGMLLALPAIVGGFATIMGGWILDKITGREKFFLVASSVLTAVFLYFMFKAPTVSLVITFSILISVVKSFVLATVFALPHKLLPTEVIGTAIGTINFGGQIAGFVAPLAIGFLIGAFNGSYDAAFWFLIASTIFAGLVGLTLNTNNHSKQYPDRNATVQ
ncbi:MFS transporter [Peribacillus frigoritolerans]|uniref:MFS transporter n=1 Tax=Peribacillus frigoritolerans TaxID=450367 RepID=UPI0007BEFDCB|nr:MFS transporter [Peribacillus frigoritolerans]MCY8938667.1 MFS transporter [Peribacillus frigoritolerans]